MGPYHQTNRDVRIHSNKINIFFILLKIFLYKNFDVFISILKGIEPDEVKELMNAHHIYMTLDGRISIAGLNSKNVTYVANAFHQVTKNRNKK